MQTLVSWLLFIILLMVLARTKIGHMLIVYVLWLAVILLLVVNYKAISNLLSPIGGQ